MIAKLFSRRQAPARATAMPAGSRVYAIGDVHGRRDLLDVLLDQIEADDAARGGEPATIILLGDLVDRGPESAQVIDRLIALRAARPSTRFLLGNHEEVFLKALDGDRQTLRLFTRIGGIETILSYGVTRADYDAADYDELLVMMRAQVPPAHIDFLNGFEDIIEIGDYVFVHAGIRPEQPLSAQRPSDLRWIREEFLRFKGPHEKMVVHGHSIATEVEQLPNRIGLDTGAYSSGRLTAMGFEGTDRWVIQTGG
jgi:serine/threonine protein phosphatase 1